jgi:hypothetical protein
MRRMPIHQLLLSTKSRVPVVGNDHLFLLYCIFVRTYLGEIKFEGIKKSRVIGECHKISHFTFFRHLGSYCRRLFVVGFNETNDELVSYSAPSLPAKSAHKNLYYKHTILSLN